MSTTSSDSEDAALMREALTAFRKRSVEPGWERLNVPDAARFEALWSALTELSLTSLALCEQDDGLALSPSEKLDVFVDLGRASPALALGLLSHLSASALVREAAAGKLGAEQRRVLSAPRIGLFGCSPLDRVPEPGFTLAGASLSGSARVVDAFAGAYVLPASADGGLKLCIVPKEAPGVRLESQTSSHGLRLLHFGELSMRDVKLGEEQILPWPSSGHVANEVDGLLCAVLLGMARECSDRAVAYAKTRYQGGKMIHEHDAVQQLVGPMLLADRAVHALSLATLSARRAGDASASAFTVKLVRGAVLDAIQTFGGYGYMEDFRIERYARDANTLETFVIHAAAREREIARAAFAALAD